MWVRRVPVDSIRSWSILKTIVTIAVPSNHPAQRCIDPPRKRIQWIERRARGDHRDDCTANSADA